MDCSTPGSPVLCYLPEFAQIHVHWMVMLSNHLILCHLLLLMPSVFPSVRVFANEFSLCIRWPEYQSFSLSISPFNEYSRLTGFISLQSKRLSRAFSNTTVQKQQVFSPAQKQQVFSPAPQFEGINSLLLGFLYGPTLIHIHDYWKNCSFVINSPKTIKSHSFLL